MREHAFGEADSLTVTVLMEDSVARPDLTAKHGLSLWVEVSAGDVASTFLVDVGSSPGLLWENMATLGLRGSAVDAIMVTHCHYDHTGGLAEVVRRIGRKGLPVVAHPAVFRPNFVTRPRLRHAGVRPTDSAADLAEAGACVILTADPLSPMEGVITSGEVPRITEFEDPGLAVWTVRDGKVVPDPMLDDVSLIVNLKGRGLVVLTGCSHAGIINILKHAAGFTGVNQIHAVLGGFHLLNASPERIQRTVAEILRIGPRWVISGHCTGTEAQCSLRQALGQRWKPLAAGSCFQF